MTVQCWVVGLARWWWACEETQSTVNTAHTALTTHNTNTAAPIGFWPFHLYIFYRTRGKMIHDIRIQLHNILPVIDFDKIVSITRMMKNINKLQWRKWTLFHRMITFLLRCAAGQYIRKLYSPANPVFRIYSIPMSVVRCKI